MKEAEEKRDELDSGIGSRNESAEVYDADADKSGIDIDISREIYLAFHHDQTSARRRRRRLFPPDETGVEVVVVGGGADSPVLGGTQRLAELPLRTCRVCGVAPSITTTNINREVQGEVWSP